MRCTQAQFYRASVSRNTNEIPIYSHHHTMHGSDKAYAVATAYCWLFIGYTHQCEAKRGIYIYLYILASFVQVSHRWHQILNFQQTRPPNKHKHLRLHCQCHIREKKNMLFGKQMHSSNEYVNNAQVLPGRSFYIFLSIPQTSKVGKSALHTRSLEQWHKYNICT